MRNLAALVPTNTHKLAQKEDTKPDQKAYVFFFLVPRTQGSMRSVSV